MTQIILYDRNPEKDALAAEFFDKIEKMDLFEKKADIPMDTDSDFEKIFIKCAEEWKPETFAEFKEKVAEVFDNKLDARLERWAAPLAIARPLLSKLF